MNKIAVVIVKRHRSRTVLPALQNFPEFRSERPYKQSFTELVIRVRLTDVYIEHFVISAAQIQVWFDLGPFDVSFLDAFRHRFLRQLGRRRFLRGLRRPAPNSANQRRDPRPQ